MNIKTFIALAEQAGVKLEVSGGIPTWEAFPGARHQKAIQRIFLSVTPAPGLNEACGCYRLLDTYIRFPDGSLKRPDLAIFCSEPPDTDEALTLIPDAVVEVVSKDYEAKDLELNPPLYLAHGIQDVVVVDPRTERVLRYQPDGLTEHTSPIQITLRCGCQITV